MNNDNRGFTLVELMTVVVIIAILATIAYPSYRAYVRRANATQAQQEMQKIAEQLERHKSRNFSYQGFDPATLYGATNSNTVNVPIGSTGANIRYVITLVDGGNTALRLNNANARGLSWRMMATVQNDPQNFNFLMDNTGRLNCKSRAAITFANCGGASEAW